MSDYTAYAPRPAPVVVGVDGSPESTAATEFAAAEAHLRQLPLLVVHCFMWPLLYPPLLDPDWNDPGPKARALNLLAAATDEVRGKHPELDVRTQLRNGPAAAMLIDASARASLVVLGHHGTGGFAGLHTRSVAVNAAAHARCPVAVVHGEPGAPHAPVVLGVDGSPESELARDFAFAAARRRRVPLRVVAVSPPGWVLPPHLMPPEHRPETDFVLQHLGDLPERYPDVVVEPRVPHGESPAGALLGEAPGAGLVVVGARGLGGLRGILLGSVGRALVTHAPCPVVIAR